MIQVNEIEFLKIVHQLVKTGNVDNAMAILEDAIKQLEEEGKESRL